MLLKIKIEEGAGHIAVARYIAVMLQDEFGIEATLLLDGKTQKLDSVEAEAVRLLSTCTVSRVTIETERESGIERT